MGSVQRRDDVATASSLQTCARQPVQIAQNAAAEAIEPFGERRASGRISTGRVAIRRCGEGTRSAMPPPARASSQAPCAVGAQPATALNPIACTVARIRPRCLRGPPKSRSVVLTSTSTDGSPVATTFGEYCSIAMVTRACAAASAQASRS
jgi:hypothetical protein